MTTLPERTPLRPNLSRQHASAIAGTVARCLRPTRFLPAFPARDLIKEFSTNTDPSFGYRVNRRGLRLRILRRRRMKNDRECGDKEDVGLASCPLETVKYHLPLAKCVHDEYVIPVAAAAAAARIGRSDTATDECWETHHVNYVGGKRFATMLLQNARARRSRTEKNCRNSERQAEKTEGTSYEMNTGHLDWPCMELQHRSGERKSSQRHTESRGMFRLDTYTSVSPIKLVFRR